MTKARNMYEKIKDNEKFGIIVVRIVNVNLDGKLVLKLQMIPYEDK